MLSIAIPILMAQRSLAGWLWSTRISSRISPQRVRQLNSVPLMVGLGMADLIAWNDGSGI